MQTTDPTHISAWLIVLIPVVLIVAFTAVWLLVTTLLANLSGWVGLAKTFRSDRAPVGRSYGFGSGRIGMVNFRNCLNITVGDSGFQVSIWSFLGGFGAPPLFIPYAAIAGIDEKKALFMSFPAIRLRESPTLIAIYGDPGRAIEAAWAKSSVRSGR